MAIAFDAKAFGTSSGGSVSSLTFSHTCTGTNLVLVVGIKTPAGVSVTYNSVSMTEIDSVGASDRATRLFLLIAPATGAHNVVVSGGTGAYDAVSASYTGCKQSAQPDAHITNTASGASTLTTSITTVANNCWTVMSGGKENGGTLQAGTGSNLLFDTGASLGCAMFDSNAAITPAGSYSMEFHPSAGSGVLNAAVLSLSPVAAATTALPYRALLGVGI